MEKRLTKIRIPSASFCQRSVIALPSPAAIENLERHGSVPSGMLKTESLIAGDGEFVPE
jgi:hypothetical protein